MTRRSFTALVCGVVAALTVKVWPKLDEPRRMKHLFQNDDGELVAADTAEQAGRYHDCELGGYPEPVGDWRQLDDDEWVDIRDCETDAVEVKTAAEWAAEFDQPGIAATTYW